MSDRKARHAVDDGYALLRAIEADPDEDTPRLAYADWLDEHATTDADRARGEYIRLTCEWERDPDNPERNALIHKSAELIDKHRKEWDAKYPLPLAARGLHSRGFVLPTLTAAEFVEHAAALAAITPLHFVHLTHAARSEQTADALAACPQLRCVRILSLDGNKLRNYHVAALAGSPHFVNLRALHLNHNRIGAAGCAALATAALPALRTLALANNPIKDRGLAALTGAGWFPNLLGLHVPGCGLSANALVRLAGLPQVANLRSLNVTETGTGEAAAQAILSSAHPTKLERLWLWPGDLTGATSDALRARFGDGLNPASYRYD